MTVMLLLLLLLLLFNPTIRSASFLIGCLLHRYFNVVRAHALRVLNRSHSGQRKSTAFPLKDLARMLAFTNENEVRCGLISQ